MRSLAREFELGGVILFARNIEAPEQVAELSHDVAGAGDRAAALGQRRSGGRPRRAAQGAVHRVAADGDARPERRRAAGGAVRGGAGRRAAGRSASRSTTRRCSTSTPTRRTRSSATARSPRTPTAWRGSARPSSEGLQDNGVAACGKHFPGSRRYVGRLASRAAARRASAGSHPARRVRAVPRGDSRRASRSS